MEEPAVVYRGRVPRDAGYAARSVPQAAEQLLVVLRFAEFRSAMALQSADRFAGIVSQHKAGLAWDRPLGYRSLLMGFQARVLRGAGRPIPEVH